MPAWVLVEWELGGAGILKSVAGFFLNLPLG
jgi:hypothetical protein